MSYAERIKKKVYDAIREDKDDATPIPKEDLFELAAYFAGASRVYLNAYKKVDPEGYEFLKNSKESLKS